MTVKRILIIKTTSNIVDLSNYFTKTINNRPFLNITVGHGYGYRLFKKPYGWLWLGYTTILTIITKRAIIIINGYHG